MHKAVGFSERRMKGRETPCVNIVKIEGYLFTRSVELGVGSRRQNTCRRYGISFMYVFVV